MPSKYIVIILARPRKQRTTLAEFLHKCQVCSIFPQWKTKIFDKMHVWRRADLWEWCQPSRTWWRRSLHRRSCCAAGGQVTAIHQPNVELRSSAHCWRSLGERCASPCNCCGSQGTPAWTFHLHTTEREIISMQRNIAYWYFSILSLESISWTFTFTHQPLLLNAEIKQEKSAVYSPRQKHTQNLLLNNPWNTLKTQIQSILQKKTQVEPLFLPGLRCFPKAWRCQMTIQLLLVLSLWVLCVYICVSRLWLTASLECLFVTCGW